MFLGNFSGLYWVSFPQFALSPLSLLLCHSWHTSYLSFQLPYHSFVLLQQTTHHNDCYILGTEERFGRGYLVAFFLVKFLLLINRNKNWRKLIALSLNIFSWYSFPPRTLASILRWWVKWTITILCAKFINSTFEKITWVPSCSHRTYSL